MTPRRTALACGALGRYDRRILRRLAAAMPARMTRHHADGTSALMLDRKPIQWSGRGRRGLAWSEAAAPGARQVDGWEEAAREHSAAGLVIDGERRFVHSSISGVAPVYFAIHEGAAYFASRIDPLVAALPGPLTADWQAWSSVFCLRYPLGTRTPFAEVNRLPAFSTLEPGVPGRGPISREPWPWANVEPTLNVTEGATAIVEAVTAALGSTDGQPLICPLSGGWDSRVLLYCLARAGAKDIRALTVAGHCRTDREETFAAAAARQIGVQHEVFRPDEAGYWEDARERALRCDYQLPADPWMMPLANRLRGLDVLVPDGLGLDVFAFNGRHFYTRAMIHPDGSERVAAEMWELMGGRRMRRNRPALLSRRFSRAMERRSRQSFLRQTERFRGHPAEPVLIHFATRTLRGISLTPHAILGADTAAITPFSDDRVVRACLATKPEEKFGLRLQPAIFDILAPESPLLPSTNDPSLPPAARTPLRRLSRSALAGYREVLRFGPLHPYLGEELRAGIASGDLSRILALKRHQPIVEAVVLFHLWHDRYAGRVRNADPAEALRLESPRAVAVAA